jgi:phosphoadenosine phosphosulfate reductase
MSDQHLLFVSDLRGLSAEEGLKHLSAQFPGGIVFSSSFSNEDQVITDLIRRNKLGIDIFTLDTGRLFNETYSVWSRTVEQYGNTIEAYYPGTLTLEKFISENGPNGFYTSVENRKACCRIRKVEPLKRALTNRKVWVTGLRAEHSEARQELEQIEWDATNKILKYHPILHWTNEEVKTHIDQYQVPYNVLHDKGFVSIGCAPCTRAVRPGEAFRAGRWWWENNDKKECGLHNN